MLTAMVLRNIETGEYEKQGGNPFKTKQFPSAIYVARRAYIQANNYGPLRTQGQLAYKEWCEKITPEDYLPYKKFVTVRITLPFVVNGVTITPYSEEIVE